MQSIDGKTYNVINNMVVVLGKRHNNIYNVLVERQNPISPGNKFVPFDVNGHEFEKIKKGWF